MSELFGAFFFSKLSLFYTAALLLLGLGKAPPGKAEAPEMQQNSAEERASSKPLTGAAVH